MIETPSPAQIHRALQERLDELRYAEAASFHVEKEIKAVEWLINLWRPQELEQEPGAIRWLN